MYLSLKQKFWHEFIKRFGITVAFLSTYSGLTRWQDFPQNIGDREARDEPRFHQLHNKAIDEVWYKRAVEQHFIEPRSFVYSVPFDVGDENYTLVTASHAIFKEDGSHKAPAAVVGFQFYHSALRSLFAKITTNCGNIPCKRTCSSQELYCLILDDNAYVIVSDNPSDTGKFFGEIRSDIMYLLIEEGVYKPNRMYDYQATCFRSTDTGNDGSRCLSFVTHFIQIFMWAMQVSIFFLYNSVQSYYYELDDVYLEDYSNLHLEQFVSYPCNHEMWLYTLMPSFNVTIDEKCNREEIFPSIEPEHVEDGYQTVLDEQSFSANEKEFDPRVLIKKTSPEPCDHEIWLYTLGYKNATSEAFNKTMTPGCNRPFIVQPVIGSNMILLVINNVCYQEKQSILMPELQEIDYNMSLTCFRVFNEITPRRHYMSCINRSRHESEIESCGDGTTIPVPLLLILLSFSILRLL